MARSRKVGGNRQLIAATLWLLVILLLVGGCGLRSTFVAPKPPAPEAPTLPEIPPGHAPEARLPKQEPVDKAVETTLPEYKSGDEIVDLAGAYLYFIRGKSAELAGRLDEASHAYLQALLRDREAIHVMRRLTAILLHQNQFPEAIIWVQRIIELRPHDIDSLALLANLYTTTDQPLKAAAIYREILEIDPNNAEVMLLLGSLYADDNQLPKALTLLQKLRTQHPDFFQGHYYLAQLYLELGQVEAALAAYEQALALDWSPSLAHEVAAVYESAGLYQESLGLYQQLIADDPADHLARSLLADIYLRLNQVDAALAELATLRYHLTDPGDIHNVDLTIARILVDEERFTEALNLLYTLIDDEPRLDEARSLMVMAYYKSGQIDRAHFLLDEIRPGDYGYQDAVLMLAQLYYTSNQPAAAVKILTKALADPNHRYLAFYVSLALLHDELHDAGQALLVFARALRELGPTAPVLFEYALYLDRIGNVDGALAKMQKVIALDPQNPYALNYVGYIWADRGENLEQALIYIKEAVRLRPEDGAIRDSLGWVFYRLKDYQRAVKELELAVSLLTNHPEIYHHLGDAYRKLSRSEDALNAYRRALELLDARKDKQKILLIKQKIKELGGLKHK